MALAAVSGAALILIPLLAVYRAQQGPFAFAVAQGVEVFVGGQTIAQGIQNGGLAHAVDPDEVGDLLDIQQIVGKIVPVDEPQAA